MSAVAVASVSATLPANVADSLTLDEAVKYLNELLGRGSGEEIKYSRVTAMLARNHEAVQRMKEHGWKEQGHWRFRPIDVRYAAAHWPRALSTPTGLTSPGRPRIRTRGGRWQEERRRTAREAEERRREQEHGGDTPSDTEPPTEPAS